jgi:hypothetical protein
MVDFGGVGPEVRVSVCRECTRLPSHQDFLGLLLRDRCDLFGAGRTAEAPAVHAYWCGWLFCHMVTP